jgi:hypothetical protein
MRKMGILRWSFAAAAAVSLVFGTAQAFAAPGAQQKAWCDPYECATTGCPEGCGPGWCGYGGCYCHC